jgi:hypothetical protein
VRVVHVRHVGARLAAVRRHELGGRGDLAQTHGAGFPAAGRRGASCNFESKRRLETGFSLHRLQGLKPAAFERWVNWIQLVHSTCTAPPDERARVVHRHLEVRPQVGFGYMDHTGCHRLVFFAIRPTRVLTPGGRGVSGWSVDHTGCHDIEF